jgi:hypothetical protein
VLLADLLSTVPRSQALLLAGFKGQLGVYATSNGLLAGLIAINIATMYVPIEIHLHVYKTTRAYNGASMLAHFSSFKWIARV